MKNILFKLRIIMVVKDQGSQLSSDVDVFADTSISKIEDEHYLNWLNPEKLEPFHQKDL